MIPTERLHELAAYASDPCADLQHQLAAELLAAREAERELVDVLRLNGFRKCDVPACNCDSWHQVDGYAARFREIDDAIGDHNGKTLLQAVQEVLAERDAARESMSLPGYQRLVDERDAALAELSALHARIEQSHNGYQETGKALGMDRPASHLIALGELLTEQVELADSVVRIERDEARAEVERVAKQRDELIRAKTGNNPDDYFCCSGMECGCHGVTVREYELHCVDRAIAAEKPKPACHLCNLPMPDGTDGHGLGECVPVCPTCDGSGTAEQPPVGWFRLNGVEFHPVDGTAEERERAVAVLTKALGVKMYPKPAGGA